MVVLVVVVVVVIGCGKGGGGRGVAWIARRPASVAATFEAASFPGTRRSSFL